MADMKRRLFPRLGGVLDVAGAVPLLWSQPVEASKVSKVTMAPHDGHSCATRMYFLPAPPPLHHAPAG
jgi:hypothetical protein